MAQFPLVRMTGCFCTQSILHFLSFAEQTLVRSDFDYFILSIDNRTKQRENDKVNSLEIFGDRHWKPFAQSILVKVLNRVFQKATQRRTVDVNGVRSR